MKPNISEFSYGYTLTDELINWHGAPLTAAPVFPSLYQEGQPGGGYDVRLKWPGILLFLQFKLSHHMVRKNTQERRDKNFLTPFYRMKLRPSRHSKQHQLLLDLENAKQKHKVYYCAPEFHTPKELNEAYLGREICECSLWIKPSKIGPLPDDRDHHIAFTLGSAPWLYSEPHRLKCRGEFSEFEESILGSLNERPEDAMQERSLRQTVQDLEEILSHHGLLPEPKSTFHGESEKLRLLHKIAFYARTCLDSQLFIVLKKPDCKNTPD